MNFTDTGTLTEWVVDGVPIIPRIRETKPGTSRGGAFLCLPNFEQLPPPFDIKHGEYRKVHCNPMLPHQKILESSSEDGWGTLSVSTDWKEILHEGVQAITVTTTLGALSEKVYLRPGFHPYFTVDGTFSVTIGDDIVDSTTLETDMMQAFVVHTRNKYGKATLLTGTRKIIISCAVLDQLEHEEFCYSFCVWSDNKKEYICVEPVIGGEHMTNNLPVPFTLLKGKELTLIFTVEVEHL